MCYRGAPQDHRRRPQDASDPIKLDEFKALRRIAYPCRATRCSRCKPMRIAPKLFFIVKSAASRLTGRSVPELRQKYLEKQADAKQLHTDCHEISSTISSCSTTRERAELEEAHEFSCSVVIFARDFARRGRRRSRYANLWSEQIGLTAMERTIALGSKRALAELISKTATRKKRPDRGASTKPACAEPRRHGPLQRAARCITKKSTRPENARQ